MFNIYDTLRYMKYFIDNEYLKKYCQLVERHKRTAIQPRVTHKHHIIPRSWFRLTSNNINDDLNNLVNLPTREHILAHYYLCLCTEDPFKYANQLALVCLQESKKFCNNIDKLLLQRLPLYNNIYEDYIHKRKINYSLYLEETNDNKSNS